MILSFFIGREVCKLLRHRAWYFPIGGFSV
jgi:hypothetical protein